MPYFYLVVAIFTAASSSITSSIFSVKKGESRNAEIIFNLIMSLSAALAYLILFLFDRTFDVGILPYACGFGVCSFCCFIFLQRAVQSGPVSITSLLFAMSLVISTIWGFIFWKDASVTVFAIIGIILVVLSSALCILKKEKDRKFNWRWLIDALIAMGGNAACTILVKEEQIAFSGKCGTAFMMVGMAVAFLLAAVFALIMRKKIEFPNFKKSFFWPIIGGVCYFLVNWCVILMASTTLSPNVIYPAISVGSIVLPIFYSLIFLKEKITWVQWLGIAVGIAAVIFLNF